MVNGLGGVLPRLLVVGCEAQSALFALVYSVVVRSLPEVARYLRSGRCDGGTQLGKHGCTMRYTIDSARSSIWIDARSSVHPIHSEIRDITGYFEASVNGGNALDVSRPVAGRITVEVARLASGNPLYDREMHRRVDARRYPTIEGALVSMSVAAGGYATEGDVTFHGVTKRVEDLLTVSMPDEKTVVFEGEHTFDVRDFGVEPPRMLMLRVHPDVTVRLRMVASADVQVAG